MSGALFFIRNLQKRLESPESPESPDNPGHRIIWMRQKNAPRSIRKDFRGASVYAETKLFFFVVCLEFFDEVSLNI